MNIAGIETIRCGAQPNLLLLRVHCENGMTGLGETYYLPGAVEAVAHELLAGFVLGRLGRMARVGDTVEAGGARLKVEASAVNADMIWPARAMVASVPSIASTLTHADPAITTVCPMSNCARWRATSRP